MTIKDIDVTFDFTSDSKGYWEGFWERNNGLGYGTSKALLTSSSCKTLSVRIIQK